MAIRSRQKKRNAEPRQEQKHRHLVIDPMVNPGSSAHLHQARSKADPTRPHHRMVTLAQSSSGDRSACASQSKKATVMLGLSGRVVRRALEAASSDLRLGRHSRRPPRPLGPLEVFWITRRRFEPSSSPSAKCNILVLPIGRGPHIELVAQDPDLTIVGSRIV